jgi:hypothetical protein
MTLSRSVATGLLLASLAALAPTAAADVSACAAKYCDGGDAAALEAFGKHADACVVGVEGGCDPYDGHLARVDVDGKEYFVPDPCYTTACF